MSLLSQEVLDDVRELITEITKFQEHDENFAICERYCISHVVHHTYPSTSRSSVKNMIASYASRFYSHGYFKLSEELNSQVKNFLSNEKLFEKNPEYDIQWSLLSLLCSLSSNLTSVKQVPKLLPVYEEDDKVEEFDWKEYLTKDLPKYDLEELTSEEEEEEESDEEEESEQDAKNEGKGDEKKVEILFDNINAFRSEIPLESQKRFIEKFLKRKKSKTNLENDVKIRGNISEKIEKVLSEVGIIRKMQLMSEFEMMEHILYQFQSGEKILLRKGLVNPSLTSVTQDTLSDYLESLQPYFTIIRCFKDFDVEVSEARYPEKIFEKYKKPQSNGKNELSRRKISNVLCVYNVMLKNALEPFQKELTEIVENLDGYTLIKIENRLQRHYFFLTSLYSVHKKAVKNWKNDTNWMASMRMLSVLHNAVINSTTTRMSLLYLNLFLHCFEVYLNIIDSWISFVDLKDPNDDFIIVRNDNGCSEYEVRDYKTEMNKSGVTPVPLVDSIAEKMIDVGQSLEILRKLNRFVPRKTSKETSFQILIKTIQEKVTSLGGIRPTRRKSEQREVKQRGIFTVRNTSYGLRRGNGGGDSAETLFQEILKEKKEMKEEKPKEEKKMESYREFIYSMVGNPFFKAAFDDLGVRQAERKLEEANQRKEEETGEKALLVVKIPEGGERGLYPFHKIIWEAFREVMESRVSSACAMVKEIVLKECDLPGHLSLFRSLLLFNDSYLIQSFILTIFNQPTIWYSSYSLTTHLKECLRGIYKHQVNALTVTVNNATNFKNVLQAIDHINVNYEVQCPLSLIFTSDVMRKYNDIFRLALKLKWAHWTLSGQHFNREKPIHRVQVLRFWFLSDLGRINNYFMAQMTSHDLKLDSCNDFKDIIQRHCSFVNKVHRDCLLGEESTENRKLILEELLPLCMELSLEGTDIPGIEKTFRNCHNKLSRLMTSLEK